MKKVDKWSKRIGLFLFLGMWMLAGCSSSSDSDPNFNPAVAAQLQNVLDTVITEYRIPGAIMGVQRSDGSFWYGSSGVASLSSPVNMTTDLILKVGSVSKTFVATVVLQLTESSNGSILKLTQTLGEWMPAIRALPDVPDNWSVPSSWESLTLWQLLNHTTGIIEYNYDTTFRNNYYLPAVPHVWQPYQLVDISAQYPLAFKPGTQWLYSNTDYILLGMIVEAATGISIEDQVQQRVIAPLWLSSTYFPTTADFPEPHAQGYTDQNGNGFLEASENVTSLDPSYSWAAGAIVTNIKDLLTWSVALARGDLLEAKTQAERMTWYPPDSPPLTGYGLGLSNEQGYIGHIGDILGYQAIIEYYEGNAIAVLINGEPPKQVAGNLSFNSVSHEIFARSLSILSLPTIVVSSSTSSASTQTQQTAAEQTTPAGSTQTETVTVQGSVSSSPMKSSSLGYGEF
jgi:D-alanyl-D-alanine carboxypeptidase